MSEIEDIIGKTETKKSYGDIQKERRQKCYDMLDTATAKVVQTPSEFRTFLDVCSRFEKYSLNNDLLIYAQRPDATRLKDYDAWNNDECHVKKGAKGISILEPQTYTSKDGDERISYNAKSVFDISDIDGAKSEASTVYDIDILISAIVHDSLVNIATDHNYPAAVNDNSYYSVNKKTVFVRPSMAHKDIFLAVAEGLAHAEMAKDDDNYRPDEHAFAARCAAYVIARKYGVDTAAVNIESLPARFRNMEAKDIRAELSEIHDSVEKITDRMKDSLSKTVTQNKKRDGKGAR